MADVELLPCPFCGAAPRFDGEHGVAVCVLCGECGASSAATRAVSEDEAAAAWNTRANLAPLQAEIETLRAEVTALQGEVGQLRMREKRAEAYAVEKVSEALKAVMARRDAGERAERLAEALRNSSDALERLAFAIPAPNAHTPQLVELAIAMRAAALAEEDRND